MMVIGNVIRILMQCHKGGIMKKIVIISMLILICITGTLTARANDSIAIGGQLGFLASGVVVDAPLGNLDIQAGLNYPLGFKYIEWATESEEGSFFVPFFVVTADVTYPISLGEFFDLKFGVGTLGFTDFESGIFGAAGLVMKGEYWIEEKDMGLFMNMNVPVAAYIANAEGDFASIVHPMMPLLTFATSTMGVLFTL